ncbi:MAG TPA: hypothetical protein PLP11_05530, partial [Bacteroidales bacterium]|nr:hypothetical protein [Bacteroidales bacterium]
MTKTITVFLFLSLFCSCVSLSQPKQSYHTQSKKAIKNFETALELANNRKNGDALQLLYKAIEIDSTFIEAYVLMNEIFTAQAQYKESTEMLKKIIQIDPYYDLNYYMVLAQYEYKTGRYDESKMHISFFMENADLTEEEKSKTEYLLKRVEFAIVAYDNPSAFEPINLGNGVNTKYDEYWPSLTADEEILVFTRLIPGDEYGNASGEYQEDVFISHLKDGNYMPAYKMPGETNTEYNEGAQCIAQNGKICILTACNMPDGYGSCDLYISYITPQGWSKPRNLGKMVNLGSWDSNPSLSADASTLYFASNRGGGMGKMDIWSVALGPDGFPVSNAVNLGPVINTEFNECSPFIHPDDRTLYFASDGHIGLGSYDLFLSRKDPVKGWGNPENLGYPINTQNEERSLIVNAKGDVAMFASARERGKGLDIYKFNLPPNAKPVTVSYVKGYVYDVETGNRLKADCKLIDLETEILVAEETSDAQTGNYLVCLPIDRDYAFNVSKQGYLFFSENFSLSNLEDPSKPYIMNIPLQPVKEGTTVVLKNIFFDFNKFDLKETSFAELNVVIKFLIDNPHFRIEIGGHTDNVGSAT